MLVIFAFLILCELLTIMILFGCARVTDTYIIHRTKNIDKISNHKYKAWILELSAIINRPKTQSYFITNNPIGIPPVSYNFS